MQKSLLKKSQSAQGMVEFALVLPIILLIIFGVIAFGHLFFVYSSVVSASREAARWGAATGASTNGIPHYKDCDAIKATAVRVGSLAGVATNSVQVSYDKGPGDANNYSCPYDASIYDRIKVTVTVNYTPFLPLVNLPGFPITATSKRTIMLAQSVGEVPAGGSIEPTTAISLVPSPNQSAISSKSGNKQDFNIVVTASDGSVPSGTVTFVDTTTGQNSSCGASWSPPSPAGTAKTCSFTFTTTGAHNLVVSYTPTGNYIGPSPITRVWPVASKSTTAAFTSITPSTQQTLGLGVNVVVHVAVQSPDTGTPDGNVTLTYGSDVVAQGAVNASGDVSFNNLVFTTTGTNKLIATYAGNSNFGASQVSQDYTINAPKQPVLTLTANPATSVTGSSITFTLNVKGPNTGDPTPTGSATISDNASHSCTANLNGSGNMTCTWSYAGGGSYTVTASYAGDGSYSGRTTTLTYQVTQPSNTQTILTVSPSTGFANQTATITAQVTSPGGTPTGTVNITGTGGLTCPNPLTLDGSGKATCTYTYTQVNSPSYQWSITANYTSNSVNFNNSTNTIAYTVNPDDTSITITPSPDSDHFSLGNLVTFTIQVNSTQGGTPVGTVSVTGDNGINCPNLTLSGGKATCSTTYSSYGTYRVTATYNSSSTAYNNSGPTSYDYFAWPLPTSPASNCPQPPSDFAINFGTAKQINFQVSNPKQKDGGVQQSVTSVDVYWPNSAQTANFSSVAMGGTTLWSSSPGIGPTIAHIPPDGGTINGGTLGRNTSKTFSVTFDHELGSGTYVVVVTFSQNSCALTVRSTH